MRFRLCLMFFLSGGAALLFETLWFHQAGQLLGNSVWTSSIVLASFMAGLAVGNGAVARWGARLHRPLRLYARLEWTIGASGLALVLLFPELTRIVAPGLAETVHRPWLLDATRLFIAFALMIVPSSAMGATLPVLLSGTGVDRGAFGRHLGLLYGWNTLGAVVGSLLGEFALVELLGVRGSGIVAAAFNLTAGLIAWHLDRSDVAAAVAPEEMAAEAPLLPGPRGALLLAATFLAGGAMLALEVVWFRFLLLYAISTSRTFSVMLAVILAGISLGGLVASRVLRRWPAAPATAALAALAAGTAAALGYATFWPLLRATGFFQRTEPSSLALLAAYLILPTAIFSGLLFTLLGQALREHVQGAARAAGLLTLSNTVGAMLGSFAGAFLLIPTLGVEGSFFVLALVYGVAAACALPAEARGRRRLVLAGGLAAFALVLLSFPFGLMRSRYLLEATRRWVHPEATGYRILAAREGTSETLVYLSSEMWGKPIDDRLLTNGYSMSGSRTVHSRYMRLFAYWPLALNPAAKRALLISFGVGTTAEALTESASLETIDVVDVSRDILQMGRVLFPAERPYPLDDPRVRTHVEDGRFFLLTTRDRFDIITGEPPPPKNAGIVSLYSREYFTLLRERLADGGLATYWLPVLSMTVSDARSITRAFCDAFPDCSLWTGFGAELILAGTRGRGPVPEPSFAALWKGARTGPSLAAIGMDGPAELGASFIADAAQLAEWTKGAPPVVDDHPYRLQPGGTADPADRFWGFLDPRAAAERFAQSRWIREVWPPALREATLRQFEREAALHRISWIYFNWNVTGLPDLELLLREPRMREPIRWLLTSNDAIEAAARAAEAQGVREWKIDRIRAAAALSRGDLREGERLLRGAPPDPHEETFVLMRVLILCVAGDRDAAERLVREAGERIRPPAQVENWRWLLSTYHLPDPFGLSAAGPPG